MTLTRSWLFFVSSVLGSACVFGAVAGEVKDHFEAVGACDARAELLRRVQNPPPDGFL